MKYYLARTYYMGYSSRQGYVLDHSEGDFSVLELLIEIPEEIGKKHEGEDPRNFIEELREKAPQAYEIVKKEKGKLIVVQI